MFPQELLGWIELKILNKYMYIFFRCIICSEGLQEDSLRISYTTPSCQFDRRQSGSTFYPSSCHLFKPVLAVYHRIRVLNVCVCYYTCVSV